MILFEDPMKAPEINLGAVNLNGNSGILGSKKGKQ
jgi:hypothetical protein